MLPLPKVVETNGHMAVHFKHPVIACSIIALCGAASAETPISTYGTPGLIDMPVATPLEDGLLVPTLSYGGGTLKNTLSFQISPRVTGTFRYSTIQDYDGPGKTRYDRSFDINVLLMEESGVWPAISAGLRDFGGTGIYSSEYLVATKHFGDKLAVIRADQAQAASTRWVGLRRISGFGVMPPSLVGWNIVSMIGLA